MKLLVDECLHTSLLELARAAGHVADHVNYLALGGYKDWQLMAVIREQEYTFVTNNRVDFLRLHGSELSSRFDSQPDNLFPVPSAGK